MIFCLFHFGIFVSLSLSHGWAESQSKCYCPVRSMPEITSRINSLLRIQIFQHGTRALCGGGSKSSSTALSVPCYHVGSMAQVLAYSSLPLPPVMASFDWRLSQRLRRRLTFTDLVGFPVLVRSPCQSWKPQRSPRMISGSLRFSILSTQHKRQRSSICFSGEFIWNTCFSR